jgi:hypothetical protein|nr:hypothetical protein [Kofleriaceae bacterium]
MRTRFPSVCAIAVVVACGGGAGGGGNSGGDAPRGGDAGGRDSTSTPDGPVPIDAPCGSACAPLATSWEHHYVGSGFGNTVEGIFVDGAGNTYLTGMYDAAIDLGGGALPFGGVVDILVASYSPTGDLRWSTGFGGSGNDQGTGITVAGGKVYVAGTFAGDVTLGGAVFHSAGQGDALVLVLDAATGALDTAFAHGTAGDDYNLGIAVDTAGNITVAGEFATGTLDLGGSAITGSADDNAYLASFTATGAHRWSRTLAGSPAVAGAGGAFDDAQAVVVDPAGDVTVVGEWMGTANFGSGTITSGDAKNLDFDAFVASYTSAGAPRWSRSFAAITSFGNSARTIGLGANGDVVVGGSFHGTVDFGGGHALTQKGDVDGFAVVLAGATGATTFGRSVGDSDGSVISGAKLDSHGDVVVSGRMSGDSTDLGNGVVLAGHGGEDDSFAAGFDATTGDTLFGVRWGGAGLDTYVEADALALSVHDSMAIGGVLNGPVDLGSGALADGPTNSASGFAMLVTR